VIDVYNWTSSSVGTQIFNLDIIPTLLAIPNIAEKVAYYRYFRCKGVRLTLRPTATPWHYGCLAISYVRNGSQTLNQSTTGGVQYMNNNTFLLDASSAKAVDIDIPWVWIDQWVNTASVPTGIILTTCTVAVALSMIGTSLIDAKLTLFANFIDPECALPKANSVSSIVFTEEGPKKAIPQSSRKLRNREAETKSKDHLQEGSSSSALTSVFNILAGLDEAAEMLQGASSLLALLDKPTTVSAAQRIVNARNVDLVGIEGLDNSVKLSAKPTAALGTPVGSIGEDTFSPDVYSVVRTPGYVGRFSLTDVTSEGTKLFTLPLRPGAFTDASTASTVTYYTPSYLAWYGALFRLWRGGLKVMIHFVGCAYMTARLRIVWVPPNSTIPATISDNESGDWISEVVEVTGSMDYSVTIPYLSPTIYKTTPVGLISTYFTKEAAPAADTLGSLVIFLCNPMVTITTTLTPTITGIVYGAAAEDFQFGLFGAGLRNSSDWSNQVVFSPTSGARVPKARPETSPNATFSHSFRAMVAYRPALETGLATSEDYSDLPSLCKRYAVYPLYPEEESSYVYSDHAAWNFGLLLPDATTVNHFGWITGCFVNLRGSRRFKFMWPPVAVAATPPHAIRALNPGTSGIWEYGRSWPDYLPGYQADESSLEIEVPWDSTCAFTTRNLVGTLPPLNTLGTWVQLPVTNASTNVQVGTYCSAAGDDFGMAVLQAPPTCRVDTTTALLPLNEPVARKLALRSLDVPADRT
jgi:hypothetical protein